MVSAKGRVEGTRDGAGQDPCLAAKATHVDRPTIEEPPESSRAAAARPGKRHRELPGSLPSQPSPLLDPRHVMLSDLGMGPHEKSALARVRVRSKDVARAEATPVS